MRRAWHAVNLNCRMRDGVGEDGFWQAHRIVAVIIQTFHSVWLADHATTACGRTQWLLHCSVLHLHDKKKDSCGRTAKNVRLWDQLQSTGWDKSTIPCENCSHSKLWIGSSLHWFKLWLMELNKRPVLGTVAETHQTGPNWTGAELAWWFNRARNYQGLFQLAWYALLLCYYTVCSVK